MVLENKLGITHQIEMAKAEEKNSKQKAKQLFETSAIDAIEVGTFAGLPIFTATCLKMYMPLPEKYGR